MLDPAMQHAAWPKPADGGAAQRLLERVAATGEAGAALAADAAGQAMLRALGGNAPYLADLALREAAALLAIAAEGPGAVAARALRELAATSPALPRARIAAALRQAKRIVALATAVADIGGLWRLAEVTGALSDLAQAALRLAVEHLLLAAHAAGGLALPNPDEPSAGSGLIVLAMGKLGARELNYSSDIDLVLLHDPEAAVAAGNSSINPFIRIARDIVALIEQRDADGYVFRTDLRLRPDPAATPLCVSLPTALAYYEGMAQNWERAAMLKARPVAGDLAAGAAFLQAIRPFVWRRGLDFAALADLHAMKRRIDEHKRTALASGGDPVARLCGHDVKLGQGGIREVEFVAQTLQLVWGGREPALRVRGTVAAMRLLARAGRLPVRAAGELLAAYRFLRRVEHRLQMVADRQTHALPDSVPGMAAFAAFMGYADVAAFAATLLRHLGRVRRRYAEVFTQVPDAEPLPVVTAATLAAQGFAEPGPILAALEGWRAGKLRALRSERARGLLDQVLPGLLRALARQAHPDAAFARLDTFFSRLPAGVQPLSLFQRNPQLLERVAAVLGAAPSLADHLAGNPAALDGLLSPSGSDYDIAWDAAAWLAERLRDAPALEDAIAATRRTVREADFAISVATLEGRLDADAGGVRRASLADAAIGAVLPFVLADVTRRHGVVPGGALAVVLLGKAGGREMMAGSDLDLMLVYDHPGEVETSVADGGARSVGVGQWFMRAVQGFVAALTAPDAGGALYAVDMRLRPSGNKGPVAVSLAAFERYHALGGDAWTWERMALTRARVVAGPPAFTARLQASIRSALTAAGDPAQVRADAAAMRARMLREHPSAAQPTLADAKLRRGGLVEVEFVAQALQLANARTHPEALDPNTCAALAGLAWAGVLPEAEAEMLAQAGRAWRTLQGMLRLVGAQEGALAPASVDALLHAMRGVGVAAVDLAGLRRSLDAVADEVRAAFVRHVGKVGASSDRP